MLSSIAQCNLGIAEWLRGRLADAERAFVSGIAGWRRPPVDRGCLGLLSPRPCPACPGASGCGGPDLPASAGCHYCACPVSVPTSGPAYVGLGEVAYQRNELDTALRHASEGIVLPLQFAQPPCCWPSRLADAGWDSGRPAAIRGRAPGGDRRGLCKPRRLLPAAAQPGPGVHVKAAAGRGLPDRGRRWDEGTAAWGRMMSWTIRRDGWDLVLRRFLLGPGAGRAGACSAGLCCTRSEAVQYLVGSDIEIGARCGRWALAARGEERAAVEALAGALTAVLKRGLCPCFRRRGGADGGAAGSGRSRRSGPGRPRRGPRGAAGPAAARAPF